MIGGGQIARAHALGYSSLPLLHGLDSAKKPNFSIIAEINTSLGMQVAKRLGFEKWSDDWKTVTRSGNVDLVDVVTPTYLHYEPVIDAVDHGKHVICEKPLATNSKRAREMYEAAKKAGIVHMTGFNYRRLPAVTFAKKLIEGGKLGNKIYQFRASFQEDWGANPEMYYTWRYEAVKAGAGALADLGSHIIDLARYLIGEIKVVCGAQGTFIQERVLPSNSEQSSVKTSGKGKVDVDDSTMALLRFENETLGSIEASWSAQGRKVSLEFEVNGSDGSIYYNLERPNEIKIFTNDGSVDQQGYRTILIGPHHPYGSAMVFPAPGVGMGFEDSIINELYELVSVIEEKSGRGVTPSFYDGWKVNQVIEAIQNSNLEQRWVNIPVQ
jgi:predicted dehydrogenase